MQPNIDIYSIIGIIGFIQGIFLSIVLVFHRTGNRIANYFLAAFLFVFSIDILGTIADYAGYYFLFPNLYLITDPLDWAVGPLLFLYVVALTQKGFRLKKYYFLHFVPFILLGLVFAPIWFQSAEWKLDLIKESYNERLTNTGSSDNFQSKIVIALFFCTQPLVYIILIFKTLHQHTMNLKNQFSTIGKINLKWITYLLIIITLIWMAWFILFLNLSNSDDVIILPVIFSFFVYGMGYFGLRQPAIFAQEQEAYVTKYENSPLTDDQSKHYMLILTELMEKEQLYIDSDLCLDTLSHKLSLPARYVSQIINEQTKQNFFDFVNRYRIDQAKRLLLESKDGRTNILSIAYDVGFNSKSAFNTAFKKYTHSTPSAYKKSVT
ncbi:helix-turn-helix transcriptional regulator [bacterium]|nr:MAG: helix-turn-helix transcriptional regulator [bacterium]